MNRLISIMLAEDHTVVRQGFRRLLEDQPDLKVVGEASNGRMAVEKALELKPDIVIMDITMPLMNGIEAARRIRKELPDTRILILSMYSHEHYIHQLLDVGISGYLLKDASGRDIINAIHLAMKDESFLSPSISKIIMETYLSKYKNSPKEERFNLLSNREREVFQLIAEGHPIRHIAETLCVSISTVKSHRIKIMEKLGVQTSIQLVHFAIHLGLVDPDL